jgi:trehalose 6-phosphate phosphatase
MPDTTDPQPPPPNRLDPRMATLAAVIFDMDGVITDTASVHAAAWQRLFDAYRKERREAGRGDFPPFDLATDYLRHVDGKPRQDGVRDFLASRGIELPEGSPDDDPDQETVHGLGNRKDRYFSAWLATNRARAFPGTLALIEALHEAGIRIAVISSSRNCAAVLESAGVEGLFEARVDGVEMARLGLPGKPDPAIFVRAAEELGVDPTRAAVIEDAVSGVEAGARGGFAFVVGVDRSANPDGEPTEDDERRGDADSEGTEDEDEEWDDNGSAEGDRHPHEHAAALRAAGAHRVVRCLSELLVADADQDSG